MLVRAASSAHGTGLVGGGTNGRSTLGGDGLKSERRKSGMGLNGGYSGSEEKNGMGSGNSSKGCCIVV
jgi:hypothetical protein